MFHIPFAIFVTVLSSIALVSSRTIAYADFDANYQATLFQKPKPFTTSHRPVSSECTNGGALYCCPSFIQSGEDGPCKDPVPIDMVQECRKIRPQGMACCINENEGDDSGWYCWST